MGRKIQYSFIMITNIIAWIVFTLCDRQEELLVMKHHPYTMTVMKAAPFVIFASYYLMFLIINKKHEITKSQQREFIVHFIAITAVTAYGVKTLVLMKFWFIKQHEIEHTWYRNGTEYETFGFYLVAACGMLLWTFYTMCNSKAGAEE